MRSDSLGASCVSTSSEDFGQSPVGPRELRIELTRDCPLRCLHCSVRSEAGNPVHLSAGVAMTVIKDFITMRGEKVILTGGEPLVHPELMRILESASDIGLKPILFSSGITHEAGSYRSASELEILNLKPLISGIVFSLYSGSPPKHEYITQGQYSFSMSLSAIQACVKHDIPTEVHFVPMGINHKDLLDVAHISQILGVKKVHVLRFIPHGRGEEYTDELLPSIEDYAALARVVETAQRLYPGFLDIGAAFRGIVPKVVKTCLAVNEKLVVTADGFVSPCDGFKNLLEDGGNWNIYLKPLREIYEQSPMLKRLRAAKRCGSVNQPTAWLSGNCSTCMAQRAMMEHVSNRPRMGVPAALR
jgi:MoaA/NifB/PqqE/SkfB family radical SAM enzyme